MERSNIEKSPKQKALNFVVASSLLVTACAAKVEANTTPEKDTSEQEDKISYFDPNLNQDENIVEEFSPIAQIEEETLENLTMDFGIYGEYKAVYDYNEGTWTLGWWKENTVKDGEKTLDDLKVEGGKIEFEMPFNGVINNSAGEITVNDESWTLGNPAINEDENPTLLKGDKISLEYGENNDSAGFQLWFEQEATLENLRMEFGEFGAYKAVYDTNIGAWTLGWWKENTVKDGEKTLDDLKREGGVIVFEMPFDGVINNSAGKVVVNNEEWILGNPAVDAEENPQISQGDIVILEYEPNNDSAGFQLWFE